MPMTEKLVEKLINAGPFSRKLDLEISNTVGIPAKRLPSGYKQWSETTHRWRVLPRYISDINAALTLVEQVLPGVRPKLEKGNELWNAELWRVTTFHTLEKLGRGEADDLPIAIMLALFNSLITKGGE